MKSCVHDTAAVRRGMVQQYPQNHRYPFLLIFVLSVTWGTIWNYRLVAVKTSTRSTSTAFKTTNNINQLNRTTTPNNEHFQNLVLHNNSLATTNTNTPTSKLDIAFVHIGKTGGATLAKLIRRACFSKRACHQKQEQFLHSETHLSQHITAYYHLQQPSLRHNVYLVTARDPIDRLVSWYNFRHPRNQMDVSPFRNPVLRDFYTCYPTLQLLVQNGLSTNSRRWWWWWKRRCRTLAQAVVAGTLRPEQRADHMGKNYRYYVESLLSSTATEVWVVRTEYLWDDWNQLEQLLGGEATMVRSVTHHATATAQEREPVVVHDTTLSPHGLANVCHVLREEVLVYKRLLERAANLNPTQVQVSVQRIRDKCGSNILG